MAFKKAVRATKPLRITLTGPPGCGKSWTALSIGTGLGGRIAVIDSEKGSASLYAHRFDFDTDLLEVFDPRIYIDKIHEAEDAGYSVIIIDSLSHAWSGRGGTLDIVQKFTDRSRSKNSYTEGWSQGTPIQNALIDAIMSSRCHMITTLRTKIEYSIDSDPRTGKMSPKKLGMAPVQRQDVEYEFDIIGEMDLEHNLIVSKTRFEELDNEVLRKPGKELGEMLVRLLNETGEVPRGQENAQPNGQSVSRPVAPNPPEVPPGIVTHEMVARIKALIEANGIGDYDLRAALARKGVSSVDRLTIEDAQDWIHKLQRALESETAVEQIAQRVEGATAEEAAEGSGARPLAESPGKETVLYAIGRIVNGHWGFDYGPTNDLNDMISTTPDYVDHKIMILSKEGHPIPFKVWDVVSESWKDFIESQANQEEKQAADYVIADQPRRLSNANPRSPRLKPPDH